jgi:hypothetical protein
MSKPTDGQQFWLAAVSPSYNSSVVARTFGSVREPRASCTSAFGSSAPALKIPRGR